MGAVRWVSFGHHGDPESGEVRTMDDGSVWARISDLDPRGDDDRWVLLLDPAGVEAPGVSEVRFHDVTIWIPRVENDSVISVFTGFGTKLVEGIASCCGRCLSVVVICTATLKWDCLWHGSLVPVFRSVSFLVIQYFGFRRFRYRDIHPHPSKCCRYGCCNA